MHLTTRQRIGAVTALLAVVTLGTLGSSGTAGAAQPAQPAPGSSALGGSAAPASGIGMPEGLNNTGNGILKNPVYYARALKSKLWVAGPTGLVYQSCAYTVPNGSTVDSIHGRITLPSGAVRPLRRCAYPMLANPAAAAHPAGTHSSAATPAATATFPTNGWLDDFTDYSTIGPLASVTGNMGAPAVPSAPNSNVEDFAFSAFLAAAPINSIVQPIVGWGGLYCSKNGVACSNGTGTHLWEDSNYEWDGNEVSAPSQPIAQGDTIHFSMSASKCNSSDGGCTWAISMSDDTSTRSSAFSVVSSPPYSQYTGGSLEVYNATNCGELFGNGHLSWRSLSARFFITPGNSAAFTPSFTPDPRNPVCGMYTENSGSGTGGDILWTP
jgi:hypothetical protein